MYLNFQIFKFSTPRDGIVSIVTPAARHHLSPFVRAPDTSHLLFVNAKSHRLSGPIVLTSRYVSSGHGWAQYGH